MEWYETPEMIAERARRFNELVEWCREKQDCRDCQKVYQNRR